MLYNCPHCKQCCDLLLNADTNDAVCSNCNKIITAVTDFVKRNLRANKQFVKQKSEGSFNTKCSACGQIVSPTINSSNKIVCPKCKAEMKLSKPFENVFRTNYKKT